METIAFVIFTLNVVTQSETRRFDFGPCVIYGLRKMRNSFGKQTRKKQILDFDPLTSVIAIYIVLTMATTSQFVSRVVG